MRSQLAALMVVAMAASACGQAVGPAVTEDITTTESTTMLLPGPLESALPKTSLTDPPDAFADLPEATGVTTEVSVGPAGPDGEFELTMTVFNGMSATIETMASLEVTSKSSPTWNNALIYSTRRFGESGRLCIPDLSSCSIALLALQIPSGDSLMLGTTSPALEPGAEYLVRLLGISYTDTNGEYTVAAVVPDSFIAPG